MGIKPYILAARPKTLPLAVSGIIMGSALAYLQGVFSWEIVLFGLLTAVFLQVLSNYANDFGDFKKGTDTAANRSDRALASGEMEIGQIKVAIYIVIFFCLFFGIALLLFSKLEFNWKFFTMFLLGLISIAAAIKYTVGKNAYGYAGLGDVFVFIFFGLVSVMGIFYLHTKTISISSIVAGISLGLLCVGVLNINNMRDIVSDTLAQKNTIAVRLGRKNSMIYQSVLILLGYIGIVFSFLVYIQQSLNTININELGMILTIFFPFVFVFTSHLQKLKKAEESAEYNAQLKFLSLSILGLVLLFCVIVFFYK